MKFNKSINCVTITRIKIKNSCIFTENSCGDLLNLLQGIAIHLATETRNLEVIVYLINFSLVLSKRSKILHPVSISALPDSIQALII